MKKLVALALMIVLLLVCDVVYGQKMPAARSSSVHWVDSRGNLWLFGGSGSKKGGIFSRVGDPVRYNDLWRFDGTKWRLVSGSKKVDQAGVYGTKGLADKANVPGARFNSVSWIDSKDNLWLFGGYGYNSAGSFGPLNCLWKFDGVNWTWVSGVDIANRRGVYGKKGLADASNMPGARQAGVSWVDSSDNLWLFGGCGYGSNGDGALNDLWKFDGANWVWVSGSDKVDQSGVYGSKGMANSANVHGSRAGCVSWTDSNDTLWLYGGSGYDETGNTGRFNDLWKFDGINWTWVSGPKTINPVGVYGIKGVAGAANVPMARSSSAFCKDRGGGIWVFGGEGGNGTGGWGYLNDLWKFDGTNWTCVGGPVRVGQKGVYGKKGVAVPANVPGARYGSISWIDGSGNFWLFGGSGYDSTGSYGYFNDLWKFDGFNWTWVGGSKTVDQVKVFTP